MYLSYSGKVEVMCVVVKRSVVKKSVIKVKILHVSFYFEGFLCFQVSSIIIKKTRRKEGIYQENPETKK